MNNKQLQTLLQEFPDEMPVKLCSPDITGKYKIFDFDEENILHTSTSAHFDPTAPEIDWDSEDGKLVLGDGEQYLLINPVII